MPSITAPLADDLPSLPTTKAPDFETLTLFHWGKSMTRHLVGPVAPGRVSCADLHVKSQQPVSGRTAPHLVIIAVLVLAIGTTGLASPAAVAQQADDPTGAAQDTLPPVDVKTDKPDADQDSQPQDTADQTQTDPLAPEKKKKQTTAQSTAPSNASQATVFAADDDFDSEPPVGPAAGGEVVRGSLGTGTTDVDGYVAGATSTFTKTNTRLQDIPHTVNIVTKEQIEDQGHQGLGQTLQYVPGVTVQQGEGHRDQITIRGQETTADFFTDGVRDDIQYFRDLYNIEAVEVLKGPAALVFGRGGGGGIVNRVTKKAEWRDIREATINFGMYQRKRTTIDVGGAANDKVAFRLNAMYEDSESFRDFFELERYGINPTLAVRLTPKTMFRASYQYHIDDRTVDRGVPSVAATDRPLKGFQDEFFGNPAASFSAFEGHVATATLEHEFDFGLQFRQHISYNRYDKFYQNIMAGSQVDAAGNFEIGGVVGDNDRGGYNSDTDRKSFFSQTEFSYRFNTGELVRHNVAFGADFAWQDSRVTRFVPSYAAPTNGANGLVLNINNPTDFTPVAFPTQTRDRNTDVRTQGYFFQDQIEITKYLEIIAGARFDRFEIDFFNALNGDTLSRTDNEWSPRLGVVVKPTTNVSLYASWSKSFQPSAGDQFDNLANRDDLEPEEFENREIGFKWAVMPRLYLTGALFHLDRKNQPVTVNATTVAAGETETRGGELALTGYITDAWQINMGYAHIISEISDNGDNGNARLGNSVESSPVNQFSVWNRYQFTKMFGAGVGVVYQSEFFPTIGNSVIVPSFTRVNTALYFDFNENWSAQVNAENLFDIDYFASAHNNFNISPGAPTSVYATIRAKF